jgi:hypothetical protein
LSNEDIEEYLVRLENEIKQFKDDLYRIAWYMRGGISVNDLMHTYSHEDIEIMKKIIKDNIETTKKSGMPLI